MARNIIRLHFRLIYHRNKMLSSAVRAICIALICVVFSYAQVFAAEESKPDTATLKTLFIFNLARMVDWPATHLEAKPAPLRFCLLKGDAALPLNLEAIRHRKVRQRPLSLQVYEELPSDEVLVTCHMLFIAPTLANTPRALLKQVDIYPILTISSTEQFCEQGGMVNLVAQEGQRLRLQINYPVVRAAHLRISARVLALARLIGTLPTPCDQADADCGPTNSGFRHKNRSEEEYQPTEE